MRGVEVEPREIVEREEITLTGMVWYGVPKGEEIAYHWQRFIAQENLVKNRKGNAGYEVWIWNEESEKTKKETGFVGVEVTEIEDLPLEMFVKVLPPSKYAVFAIKATEMHSDWGNKIYKEWLPKSNYEEAHKFLIEYYDGKRFKSMGDEESEIDIYIPIKPRSS